jgi:hypothetical protein
MPKTRHFCPLGGKFASKTGLNTPPDCPPKACFSAFSNISRHLAMAVFWTCPSSGFQPFSQEFCIFLTKPSGTAPQGAGGAPQKNENSKAHASQKLCTSEGKFPVFFKVTILPHFETQPKMRVCNLGGPRPKNRQILVLRGSALLSGILQFFDETFEHGFGKCLW